MLAGDYLKEASDSNVNMVGVGLLYRYGYFKQNLSISGDQIDTYSPQKFTHMPLKPVRTSNGEWLKVSIALPGRNLYAKVWRLDVGRIPLYLLDADIEAISIMRDVGTQNVFTESIMSGRNRRVRCKQLCCSDNLNSLVKQKLFLLNQ